MEIVIELSDQDMEYLKRGNEVRKDVWPSPMSGFIIVIKHKV